MTDMSGNSQKSLAFLKPAGQKAEYGSAGKRRLSQKPSLASSAQLWFLSDKEMAASLCADGHSGQECEEWRTPDTFCPLEDRCG